MKTSSPDDVPPTGLRLPLSTEAMLDADAQTSHSFTTERQARRQVEQAHEEKLRQRGARIQAANETVSAYMRESGPRDYPRAFGYIERTRPELFAQMQVPAHCRTVANSSEQVRQERRHRRWERIQAANDVVDDYMRESGTRDYPAAFMHILRTRSDLFADMHDPSGLLAAANFNPYYDRFAFPNDNPYHDAQGRFTNAAGAVPPGNKNRSPKSDPRGVVRVDHHVATVSTLRKVNFSEDVVRALEKLKVPAGITRGMPEHQNNTAHKAYNERVDKITSQYTDLARSKGQDPSTMTGKQAEAFAKGLVEQINADPYSKTFNEMVGNGATTEELKAMHASSKALLQAEPALTESAELPLATPVETSSISTEAGKPVTAKPAEIPESTGETPEGIASGSGEVSSATGAALGTLNIIGVLHDFLEAAAEEEDGDEGKMSDALAMRDFPPDKHPGFLGRLHTVLTRDPSPYYSPEQLKKFDEQRQNYRDQFKERRRRHHGVPSA